MFDSIVQQAVDHLRLISWGAWGVTVALAWVFRSRPYAIFRGVTLGLHNVILLPIFPSGGVLAAIMLYLHAMVFVESLALIRPTLRPAWYRILISWPGLYFAAGTIMAFPWAIAAGLGFDPWAVWLPYLGAAAGMLQSLSTKTEARTVSVGAVKEVEGVQRVDVDGQTGEGLRIVQITDPHLGPFMPVSRLRAICERAVEQKPDLILLTGDFLTMESQKELSWLQEALSPLAQMPGQVYACLGNHDHEAPRVVRGALAQNGIKLLVDDSEVVETRLGPIQLLGFDFHFRGRKEKMAEVTAAQPRLPGVPRIALLHDPGAFKHLPPGEVDLALSGHTHGGQVGLVSFGSVLTMISLFSKMPDHSLWGHGASRLYVHRGTGHYGFPLRLGVPAEEGVLTVRVFSAPLAP